MMQMAGGVLWREAPGDVRCIFTQGEGDCAGTSARRAGLQAEDTGMCLCLFVRSQLAMLGSVYVCVPKWAFLSVGAC
jgi:hypothetical protein